MVRLMLPFLAFAVGMMSVIVYYIGLEEYVFGPIVVTVAIAIVGVFFGDKKHPVTSRLACFAGIALACAPLGVPVVRDMRIQALARQRAAETAPTYQQIDEAVAALAPTIDAYYQRQGYYPDLNGPEILPRVGPDGRLQSAAAMPGLEAPVDPFAEHGLPMRWAAIRDNGVMIVSVGQDGVKELPLPGVMMDPPPAHPLTGMAQIGTDPRLRTYDPTNGGLSLGDVVRWHGQQGYEQAMDPLFRAWNDAEKASPYRPTQLRRAADPDPDPQSIRDAVGAQKLLERGEFLAAAALAQRSILHRSKYPAQWKAEDYSADFTKGMALYHLGAFRAAADALIDYTTSNPNDPVAHYYLAAALYKGGRRDDAVVHLTAASQIAPNDPITGQATASLQLLEQRRDPGFPAPAGLTVQP
jgi:tetratricopeptide (TPR) repeat protein